MKRNTNSKHPPVQGVQIASRISSIRSIALDSTIPKLQRIAQMEKQRIQAIEMLNQYFNHWIEQTTKID